MAKRKQFRRVGVMKVQLTKRQLRALLKAAQAASKGKTPPLTFVNVPIFEPKNSPFKVRPARAVS